MRSRHIQIAVVLCVLLATVHALYYWPEVIDDAYIIFRYARNWVAGYGISFNAGGPPVEGASSLTWFWMSVAGLRMGVHDLLTWVKITGLLLHAATTFGVWCVAARATDSRASAIVAAFLYAINPFAAYHAVAGLETPLATALIVAAAIAVLDLESHGRSSVLWLALLLPLLVATRPESFGYVTGLLVAGWIVHRDHPAARRRILVAAVFAGGALALLTSWRWMTFGSFFPNTATAKVGIWPKGAHLSDEFQYPARYFSALRLPTDTLLYLACALLLLRRPSRRTLVSAAMVACAVVFATAVRGDWMHSFRFMVPATPFVCVLVACGMATAFEIRGWPTAAFGTLRAAMVVLLAVTALQLVMIDQVVALPGHFGRWWKPLAWPLQVRARMVRGYDARLPNVTRWLLEHASSRKSVATGDIGFPGWTGDQKIIDLVGLTDRDLARIVPISDLAAFSSYINRANPDIVVMRTSAGRPIGGYDQLVAGSGLLARYAKVDSVGSYEKHSLAVMYLRSGTTLDTEPDSVLARYDRALQWNPRVTEMRAWRDEYSRGLTSR